MNDSRLIQTVQLGFSQIANVARNLFWAKFGIACNNREFFDMNRSVTIICNNLLRNQNRVFEVVTIPGHKGDQHILTKRQFT